MSYEKIVVFISLLFLIGCTQTKMTTSSNDEAGIPVAELKKENNKLKQERTILMKENEKLRDSLPADDLRMILNEAYIAIHSMNSKNHKLLQTILHPDLSIDMHKNNLISKSTGYTQKMLSLNKQEMENLQIGTPGFIASDKNLVAMAFTKTDYSLQQSSHFELTFKRYNNKWMLYTYITN